MKLTSITVKPILAHESQKPFPSFHRIAIVDGSDREIFSCGYSLEKTTVDVSLTEVIAHIYETEASTTPVVASFVLPVYEGLRDVPYSAVVQVYTNSRQPYIAVSTKPSSA